MELHGEWSCMVGGVEAGGKKLTLALRTERSAHVGLTWLKP
jgi:hypothetical protein